MAYVKNIWVDQDVERPNTYEVTTNQDGSITLTDSFGLVTELGTPVNETNMNHIEEGIDGCAIRKHNLTETFVLGEWVKGGSGDDEGLYKSLVANNVGNAITDDTKWEKISMGASRNIGEIVQSTVPLADAGLHLLDGALIDGSGSYSEFVGYIAGLVTQYPDLFETEANWQQSVSDYGSCGKFVYDSVNNTVRLPKITGFTEGTIDPTVLGDLIEAGLPNITGKVSNLPSGNPDSKGNYYGSSGCFYRNSGTETYSLTGVSGSSASTYIDASRSSSIYGNSTTVQPQAIKVLYYIVIANTTKTAIQVDIDEIATDLNGKADVDLINTNNRAKILMASMGMPSDTYIDLTLGASGTYYTAPANGWFTFISGDDGSYPKNIELETLVNNNQIISSSAQTTSYAGWLRCCLPVMKGGSVKTWYNNVDLKVFRFVYAQGSESEAS